MNNNFRGPKNKYGLVKSVIYPFRKTLGRIQPPFQPAPVAVSPRVKRLGFETDNLSPASLAVKNDSNYIHSGTNATVFGKFLCFCCIIVERNGIVVWYYCP